MKNRPCAKDGRHPSYEADSTWLVCTTGGIDTSKESKTGND